MSAVERLAAALADRYHLERELGQGGMATVYLAQDLKHDRRVAIKVLKPELAAVLGAERFTDGGRTRLERVTVEPKAHPPVRNRGRWADAPGFRDTNGPSFAMAPGGGLIYLQGAAHRPASYLHVVPHWVDRMKRAVDEANR